MTKTISMLEHTYLFPWFIYLPRMTIDIHTPLVDISQLTILNFQFKEVQKISNKVTWILFPISNKNFFFFFEILFYLCHRYVIQLRFYFTYIILLKMPQKIILNSHRPKHTCSISVFAYTPSLRAYSYLYTSLLWLHAVTLHLTRHPTFPISASIRTAHTVSVVIHFIQQTVLTPRS